MKNTYHNSQFGRLGEDIACRYLLRKGYIILARNYRFEKTEIDIIARDGNVLVFVEVKTRTSDQMAYPEQAVGRAKQKNIRHAAENFVFEEQYDLTARFDVVAVVKGDKFEIEHFEDAFYPFETV
jgi:putative endonuclease